jgi:hypothetical protein
MVMKAEVPSKYGLSFFIGRGTTASEQGAAPIQVGIMCKCKDLETSDDLLEHSVKALTIEEQPVTLPISRTGTSKV